MLIREDIETLAAFFLSRVCLDQGKRLEGFSAEALAALRSYDYPGNVRELESIVERGATFCQGPEIALEHLGERVNEQFGRTSQTKNILQQIPDFWLFR